MSFLPSTSAATSVKRRPYFCPIARCVKHYRLCYFDSSWLLCRRDASFIRGNDMRQKKTDQPPSASSPAHLPGDSPITRQEDFLAEATALFNAGKMSVELYKHLQSPSTTPFDVSIVRSTQLHDHHHVTFKCRNNTQHGIYLESFTIALPEKRDVPLTGVQIVKKEDTVSYASATASHTPLEASPARYIPPGQDVEVTIRFPVLTRSIHEQVPYLIGTWTISHLNEKKPSVVQHDFRVRWT